MATSKLILPKLRWRLDTLNGKPHVVRNNGQYRVHIYAAGEQLPCAIGCGLSIQAATANATRIVETINRPRLTADDRKLIKRVKSRPTADYEDIASLLKLLQDQLGSDL